MDASCLSFLRGWLYRSLVCIKSLRTCIWSSVPRISPYYVLNAAGALIRKAEMYQEYMKQIPVPAHRGSVIPFTSWLGLAKSVKQLYGQPLHYLTNILLKQWDLSRVGSEDERQPLDTIIHPAKAEALIWVTEEVHRLTSSPHHLAKLWASDPTYHAYVDPIFP